MDEKKKVVKKSTKKKVVKKLPKKKATKKKATKKKETKKKKVAKSEDSIELSSITPEVKDIEFLYKLPVKPKYEEEIIAMMDAKGFEVYDIGSSCIPGKRNLNFRKK